MFTLTQLVVPLDLGGLVPPIHQRLAALQQGLHPFPERFVRVSLLLRTEGGGE